LVQRKIKGTGMYKSKLITYLKSFSKKEMKEFGKFISSPFFSRERNLKPLYDVLKKHYPEFISPQFTEEKIFLKLYPGKIFEKNKSLHVLQVMVSEMTLIAEKFMQISGFLKNAAFKDAVLLKELRNRKLNDTFTSVSAKISKAIESDKTGHSYFLRKYLVEKEKEFFWTETKNKDVKTYLKLQTNTEDSLIVYFLSELIRHIQSRKMNYVKNSSRSELSSDFLQLL
jgi:hypothetical protein